MKPAKKITGQNTGANDEQPGLIVPVNLVALCVGKKDDREIFEQAPHDFSQLPKSDTGGVPNISATVMTGGQVSLGAGIHLHWALPDALTQGVSNSSSEGIAFPALPDRWLITRIYTDISIPAQPAPRLKSWVVESNYHTNTKPDHQGPITIPYKSPANNFNNEQPYHYLGRALEYETWEAKELSSNNADEDCYLEHLGAVGYGLTEFSAFYPTCRSILGFHDTLDDLTKLGPPDQDKILAYQIIGWHSIEENDPLSRIPSQWTVADFNRLLAKIGDDQAKAFLNQIYPLDAQTRLYVLNKDVSEADRDRIRSILKTAGYDFLGQLKWALPSTNAPSPTRPSHTLYTGLVHHIQWNENTVYFEDLTGKVNIAIGNTHGEALAALIANLSDLQGQPVVELLLDALQLGLLSRNEQLDTLDHWEELKLAIQKNSFGTAEGGSIWEVRKKTTPPGDSGEETLPDDVAKDLNDLNVYQQAYDQAQAEIDSRRWQIFSDWYRFMQVLHYKDEDPSHGLLDLNKTAFYMKGNIDELNAKITQTSRDPINKQIDTINDKLKKIGETYELKEIGAPRYWRPNDPVILFQGEEVSPPVRYGGDGRFMADGTMVCRLPSQLMTSFTAAPGALGNSTSLLFDAGNLPQLAGSPALLYPEEVKRIFTEACLLNADLIAALAIKAGATGDVKTLAGKIQQIQGAFLSPPLLQQMDSAVFQRVTEKISASDQQFLASMYQPNGGQYKLVKAIKDLTADESKQLTYIFCSTGYNSTDTITFSGIAASCIAVEQWVGTPWLPFALKWQVYFYPFEAQANYSSNFITGGFTLDNGNFKYIGEPPSPPFQSYRNTISLTPHAGINLAEQVREFIARHPQDPLKGELEKIAAAIEKTPLLSQSLSGLTSEIIMRHQEMQLEVGDPCHTGYDKLTSAVKDSVARMNIAAPNPSNYYHPIRAGSLKITELIIMDVFGRNIKISSPKTVYRAVDLIMDRLPQDEIYLPPRLAQPARLQFRWLSAADDTVEMNTHPASTPICGWVLCNHLDTSLWIYDNQGTAYGSLILNYDHSKIIWQCPPDSPSFGEDIDAFFGQIPNPNSHLKEFTLALFHNGPKFLETFMAALDDAGATIEPQNYKQNHSRAVLMGQPLALVRASLNLELQGLPAFNQSWEEFKNDVANHKKPDSRCDNDFSKVAFPVRLGAVPQLSDGLVGYFKEEDYRTFYTPVAKESQNSAPPPGGVNPPEVKPPADDNITLTCAKGAAPVKVTMLIEPRGEVHATTGILPVKSIEIPPDQYVEALQSLKLAFLTSPILSGKSGIAFPVPTESGGAWSWIENQKKPAVEPKTVGSVTDRATMGYSPQQIYEGWLKLSGFQNKNRGRS